jgi:hypothetical protein
VRELAAKIATEEDQDKFTALVEEFNTVARRGKTAANTIRANRIATLSKTLSSFFFDAINDNSVIQGWLLLCLTRWSHSRGRDIRRTL